MSGFELEQSVWQKRAEMKPDLCLECSTLTLFIMGCAKGMKEICHGCQEACCVRDNGMEKVTK